MSFNADKYFNKKFVFTKLESSSDNKPNRDTLLTEIAQQKSHLNNIKSETGKHDLNTWSAHTKSRDPTQGLFQVVKQNFHADLVTQAWLKFYEILSNFNIVNLENGFKYNSVHLCEAPGAFITSLNHFLSNHFKKYKFQYLAMTLNPYYPGNNLKEMINHDGFILNQFSNWYFGADDTGDIKSFENYIYLIQKVNETFKNEKINLITADGSVNCIDDPGNQEKTVNHLIFCETVTALTILSKGGNYVFKIFTMFELNTISLLQMLHDCFEKIAIFKPCTSKSGNSEVYVICYDYLGTDCLNKLWPVLIRLYQSGSSDDLFKHIEISDNFLQQVVDCIKLFTKCQIETISLNLSSFDIESKSADDFSCLKDNIIEYYVNNVCKLRKVDKRHSLMNFKEYKLFIQVLHSNESQLLINHTDLGDFYSMFNQNTDLKLDIVIGKKYSTVFSTKFCDKDVSSGQMEQHFIENSYKTNNNVYFIDGKLFYNENFSTFEMNYFLEINKIFKMLKNGDSLCLVNFFPISCFNVNVIFLLKHVFAFVGCNVANRSFLFRNFFENKTVSRYFEEIVSTYLNFNSNQNEIIFSFKSLLTLERIFNSENIKLKSYDKTVVRFLHPKLIFLDPFLFLVRYFNNCVFNC